MCGRPVVFYIRTMLYGNFARCGRNGSAVIAKVHVDRVFAQAQKIGAQNNAVFQPEDPSGGKTEDDLLVPVLRCDIGIGHHFFANLFHRVGDKLGRVVHKVFRACMGYVFRRSAYERIDHGREGSVQIKVDAQQTDNTLVLADNGDGCGPQRLALSVTAGLGKISGEIFILYFVQHV